MVEAGIVKEGTPICVPSKEVSEFNFYFLILNSKIGVGVAIMA